MPAYLLRQHTWQHTISCSKDSRLSHRGRLLQYQSDRDIESGRRQVKHGWAGGEGATWRYPGRWQAGWAQRWPKAYLTTGQVKPVSEPDSEDHIRRHQALAGVCQRVWTPSNFRSCWIRILASNSQAAMPREVRTLRLLQPGVAMASLNDKPLTNAADGPSTDKGKPGRSGKTRNLFFHTPAAQRSVSARLPTALGNQMQRDRVDASRVFRLPFRTHATTAPHRIHSLLAVFCPGPAGRGLTTAPVASLASRMPDAMAMASGVPLGCCPSRSLPWKDPTSLRHTTHSTHMCRDDSLDGGQSASSIVSPAFQTKLCTYLRTYLRTYLHAPVLHRIPPSSTSFHISPGHR